MKNDAKMLSLRISHERELRAAERAAFDHERELRAVWDHHERELRTANEASVEKARQLQYEILEARLESMNQFRDQLTDQAKTFMPVDRWQREHTNLTTNLDTAEKALQDRVTKLETQGTRQTSREDLLDALQTSRRWLYGILVTVIIFGITTTLHFFGAF